MAYAVRRLTQEKVDKAIKAADASCKAAQHVKSRLVADAGGLFAPRPLGLWLSPRSHRPLLRRLVPAVR
jgi:hypothetical protein